MKRAAIACVLCLLLAGCTAPTAPTQTTVASNESTSAAATTAGPNATTESPADAATVDEPESADDPESDTDAATNRSALEDGISVRGGSLPVEHERIFGRTTDLLGTDVSPPSVVFVESAAEIRGQTDSGGSTGEQSAARSFAGVMGIHDSGEADDGDESEDDEENEDDVSVAAYTPSATSVVVNERMTAPGREGALERTMAHEFVHTVQFRQGAFARTQRALDVGRTPTRDAYLTYVSVLEGAAVYVAETYDRRYLSGDWATITSKERYRDSPASVKYRIARYYFGERYLQHRYDSPANISSVYDDPPETTEQLLHNDTTASEDPRSLDLSVEPGRNRTLGRTDTYGELFTRIVLGNELNESRAAEGAAGWGVDRLTSVVGPNGTRNFVWATRWDSPAEADEFEAAMTDYLDSRANRSAGSESWRDEALTFRTVRTTEDTVVLLAGNESFVREVSASGTNASVSVESDGDEIDGGR